jgi:hypothetical protein
MRERATRRPRVAGGAQGPAAQGISGDTCSDGRCVKKGNEVEVGAGDEAGLSPPPPRMITSMLDFN